LIEGKDQNRAFDGDTIALLIFPQEKWVPLKDSQIVSELITEDLVPIAGEVTQDESSSSDFDEEVENWGNEEERSSESADDVEIDDEVDVDADPNVAGQTNITPLEDKVNISSNVDVISNVKLDSQKEIKIEEKNPEKPEVKIKIEEKTESNANANVEKEKSDLNVVKTKEEKEGSKEVVMRPTGKVVYILEKKHLE